MSGKFMMNGIEYLGGGSGGGGGNVDDVLVNGVSVVNEDKEAEIVSYKEVTQAEYELLPDTKLTDGIAYFIKDSVEAEGFPPLIYSTSEREIGVWIDGKPLYQKSYYISTFPNASIAYIPHGISNIGEIVEIKGTAHIKLSVDSSDVWTQLSRVQDNNINGLFAVDINGTNIVLKGRNSDFSGLYDKGYVTLQYTKITDIPGSGLWAGNGAMAHHYSTEEKIIGTWIDGKPLYEKSYVTSQFSGNYVITTDIPFDGAFVVSGYYLLNDSNGSMIGLNEWFASANYSFCHVEKATKKIRCYLMGYTGIGYFTIQYTKTTD